MQGSNVLDMIIAGVGIFFICWLTFRVGRAILNRLGIKVFLKPEPLFVMANQPDHDNPGFQPVPDGQERLATQLERDDINERLERDQPASAVSNTPL